jgi:hypothetical protein
MKPRIQYFKSKDLKIDNTYINVIKVFVDFCFDFQKIKEPLRINLVSKSYENIPSTGSYSPATKTFNVLCEGRSLVDILRTIAHELQHHKQSEEGKIPTNPQNIGGFLENEANIFAGAIIKMFVQTYNFKDLYKL